MPPSRDEPSSKKTTNAGAKIRGSYNIACDVCSRRKHKCDGVRPICQPCYKLNRSECSWTNYENRRHRDEQQPVADTTSAKQTESLRKLVVAYSNYADGLESLLDRFLQGHQHSNVMDFRASRPKDPNDLMGFSIHIDNSQLDDAWIQDDLEESERSDHSPMREICLGSNRYPLTIAEGGFLHCYGNTAPFRFNTNEPPQSSRFPAIAQNPEERYVLLVDDSTEDSYNPDFDWSRYLPTAVPLDRKSHDKALDLLFKYFTTFCLRIIPDLFLRDMCRVLNVARAHEPPKVTHYSPMLHNSLVALALAFSDDPRFRDLQARKYFVDAAKSYMETECQQPNISVVQALSFLGSFYGSQGDQGLGFLYFGLSARVAQALGLMVDCSEWVESGAIEESERIDRNWAGWTIFTSDVCWSLYVGRDFSVPLPHLLEFPMPCVDPELDNMPVAYGNLPPQPNYVTKTFEANCELFIIARSILDIINRLNRHGARPAVIDELISNVDMKLHTWFRDLAPEVQITNKSRGSSSPQKLLLHLSYYWLFILLHRPLFHLKPRPVARTGREIDHVKHCKSASRNIMELLALWDNLYGLRFSPITLIQIAFSASTVFVLSAIQACSGVRIAQKELRSSLDQQATVLNYLQIIGRSWPGAVKIATILKDLMHDRLKPLLARRKIPIQNGEILQVAELAGEDEDDPANTESVGISRRVGIPIPAPARNKRGPNPKKQRQIFASSKASGISNAATSPTLDPTSPAQDRALARSPSDISIFELVGSVGSDAEVVVSPYSSPDTRNRPHSLEIPTFHDYPSNPHEVFHISQSPEAAIFPDSQAAPSSYEGVHIATASWAPTFSNDEFSGIFGMPGGRPIPQTPFWSPISLGAQADAAAAFDDMPFLSSTSEPFSPSSNGSKSAGHSMHLAVVNNTDTDQSMDDLNQWIRNVSQGFSWSDVHAQTK